MDEKVLHLTEKIKHKLEKKRISLHLDELYLIMESNKDVILLKQQIDEKVSNIEVLQRF